MSHTGMKDKGMNDINPRWFRRQYGWAGSPYYGNAQYYETQPQQQWSSQYQNNQNYYSPYFYGYQHQQTWQNSNQNQYQTLYNRPSWISENTGGNNGYATAPPSYSEGGSYARPKYLATMQPKPTISPVILERSTVFVTPETVGSIESGEDRKHPTFLERLGSATLPIATIIPGSEELTSAEERGTLGNGELLPGRTEEEKEEASIENVSTIPSTTSATENTSSETSVLEKDEITSSEFFATSSETTEAPETSTTTEKATTTEITPVSSDSPAIESTTTTTASPKTSTTLTPEPITTVPAKDVKPVTLLAFQEVSNEVTSNVSNVTQPTVDQSTSANNLNEIGEGSGTEPLATSEPHPTESKFVTGIVGLRAPPMPKTNEKVGLEVVEWTDSDNEVRKVLLTQ
ncbi:Prion-like-(Q/N-rich)-domain-bearing protein [Caenorhabditis elegans]|uniref:Prion-like-(Q/N-rich)-domain-bearing protein n=1 Tax=Caenorhabditis elegans TaxID=6239 RepID=H2L0Q2_CAEEL|nr:Prion-like-(Q/N-rich)-domain-bearing protein [Caenorhabditis elegans]CCD74421.1 Prion-like-(Q/N-rich)-domain-bearing protein [Caenorhabditis elegans]|eukprot:NP_508507.1 Uncharacterized protein CELE_Y41G9A.5 [Caenorhabditis elegans]